MAITNCFSELYSRVQADFVDRLPGCHKSRGEGLSLIASVVLNTRSVDLMENAAALPRDIGSVDHRYQYISRVLSNSRIEADGAVSAGGCNRHAVRAGPHCLHLAFVLAQETAAPW